MGKQIYCLVSGVIFALVALLHLLRLLNAWAVQIGPFAVPTALSVFGLVFSALLSLWAFRASKPGAATSTAQRPR
jgi:hypothetical protein